MFLNNSFGKNLDIMHRSMDVSLLRRRVIANNIANSDTPNFKRQYVNFESELGRALASENKKKMEGFLTHPKHIPFNRPVSYQNVKPRVQLDYLTTSKNNGNNVDIEEEMMHSLENQLLYQTLTQSVRHQFSQINMVLQ
ncbi:MAG: flagellar basal body rod protein FlgB [Spirochaetales bacterium]|nr:flagellar basal body rod protein FlgB [Spirochaetales bacterium]MCF7937620.1 flagellar basal body rod protein FlgB [Spirochaetales bacterium]